MAVDAAQVPDGWLQVVRGPQPPAVRWPKAPRGRGQDRPQNSSRKEANKGSSQPSQVHVRRGPPQASPVAQERVVRLQSAVDALADDNSSEAKMLRDALKKAQQEATSAPVGVRLDACAQFVERARNRLSKADEALRKAQNDRARSEQELRDGEQRLEALRVEASEQIRAPPATGPVDEVANLKNLVTELRCHVAFLEENKPDNWQGLEELWKLWREVEDLRHFRDEARRSEPMEVADPSSMNPSTRMAPLIDAGDAKRRCVENPPP